MIFKISNNIKFSNFYKNLNIISFILIVSSLGILFFKGLNLGVDFKGGTLIEVRTDNPNIQISDLRQSIIKMNLGDVNVKKFGKENDYLVKIEENYKNNADFIKSINDKLTSDLGAEINFRRVEQVGPKVCKELFKDGMLAFSLALASMLFYIWIRFEWQFSLGAIVALSLIHI